MGLSVTPMLDQESGVMVKPHRTNPAFGIKELWSRQKEIIRLKALGRLSNQEIADTLGIAVSTVYVISRSELGKQMLEMLNGEADLATVDLMKRIREVAVYAQAVEEDILFSADTDPSLKHRVAEKLIDRAIGTPVTKNINMNLNTGTLSFEDIEAIKRRAAELREITKKRYEEAQDVEIVDE